jgi:hypothetical protein
VVFEVLRGRTKPTMQAMMYAVHYVAAANYSCIP